MMINVARFNSKQLFLKVFAVFIRPLLIRTLVSRHILRIVWRAFLEYFGQLSLKIAVVAGLHREFLNEDGEVAAQNCPEDVSLLMFGLIVICFLTSGCNFFGSQDTKPVVSNASSIFDSRKAVGEWSRFEVEQDNSGNLHFYESRFTFSAGETFLYEYESYDANSTVPISRAMGRMISLEGNNLGLIYDSADGVLTDLVGGRQILREVKIVGQSLRFEDSQKNQYQYFSVDRGRLANVPFNVSGSWRFDSVENAQAEAVQSLGFQWLALSRSAMAMVAIEERSSNATGSNTPSYSIYLVDAWIQYFGQNLFDLFFFTTDPMAPFYNLSESNLIKATDGSLQIARGGNNYIGRAISQ